MQFNGVTVTTRSTSFTRAVSSLLDMRMHQHSLCSWSIGHCSGFVAVLVSVFLSFSVFPERLDSLEAVSLPSPSLSFHCFMSVTGAWFSLSAWGLMAGLPGFASHGTSLHLGATCNCQQWKLVDVSDTQPPLCEAVVNG